MGVGVPVAPLFLAVGVACGSTACVQYTKTQILNMIFNFNVPLVIDISVKLEHCFVISKAMTQFFNIQFCHKLFL
jgi:hypothetical protein